MARKVLVWLTDTHGGHKLGLLNPDTELVDLTPDGEQQGFWPNLTATQEFLWHLYTDHIQAVQDIAGGDPIVVVHGGDVCHGNKYPEGSFETSAENMLRVGYKLLDPWLKVPNVTALRILTGTGAHNLGEGALEGMIAFTLKANNREHNIECYQHELLDVDGLLVDVAHHGPGPGIREWTDGNQVRYYTRSIIFGAMRNGKRPPDLVMRGHYHDMTWETLHYVWRGNWQTTHSFICPSYCGLTFHGQQATKSQANCDYGLIAVEIEDGGIRRIWPLVMTVDRRTSEQL